MFRIGEFSKLTQVSIRMLRYYDETGLLKPAKTDESTGYRYYGVEQIPLLQKIVLLRDMDFCVSEIADALGDWSAAALIRRLTEKEEELREDIAQKEDRVKKIGIALRDMEAERISTHYNVLIRHVPGVYIVSLRRLIPDYNSEGMLWTEFGQLVKAEGVEIPRDASNMAIYHDEEHRDAEVDAEVGMIVKEPCACGPALVCREVESVDTMACVMAAGPYRNIGKAYGAFAEWLNAHRQYRMAGPSRQICHKGPWNEPDPEKYLTELQTPLKKI